MVKPTHMHPTYLKPASTSVWVQGMWAGYSYRVWGVFGVLSFPPKKVKHPRIQAHDYFRPGGCPGWPKLKTKV